MSSSSPVWPENASSTPVAPAAAPGKLPEAPPALLARVAAAVDDPATRTRVLVHLEDRGGRRVPVHARAVSIDFLNDVLIDNLSECSPGQIVHGKHTCGPPDDWRSFAMDQDPQCIRGLTRDVGGLSFVETLMLLGEVCDDNSFTHSPTGAPYFGDVDIFCSYGWHGTRLGDMRQAIEFFASQQQQQQQQQQKQQQHHHLQYYQQEQQDSPTYFWIDIFAIAQNRDTPHRKAANASDVNSFSEVIDKARGTALYWSPLARPAVLDRVWCLYEILQTHTSGNSLELLLRPEDRTQLLESIAADRGRALRLQVEGQSSVNAAATYERDFCRIHTAIEVELNPLSLGEFVRAPATINGDEVFGSNNDSEGWLGQGPWVAQGAVVGEGVPPWIDYVFLEEDGRGEMDGAKEGHFVLDRLVRDTVYAACRKMLVDGAFSNGDLDDPLRGAPVALPRTGNSDDPVGCLFWAGKECKWILETASSEDVQIAHCTLSAFGLTESKEGGLLRLLTDKVTADVGDEPLQITAACTIGGGLVALGDCRGRVRLYRADSDVPGSSSSSSPVLEVEPLVTAADLEGRNREEEDEEDGMMWEYILVSLCEVSPSGHKVLAGLTEGGLLTLWDIDKGGKIICQAMSRQFSGCICSCGGEGGLFLAGLKGEEGYEDSDDDGNNDDDGNDDDDGNNDDDDFNDCVRNDDEEGQDAEEDIEEEEQAVLSSKEMKAKKDEGESEDDGDDQGEMDQDTGSEFFGCLAVWRVIPCEGEESDDSDGGGSDEGAPPLELVHQLLDSRPTDDCIDKVGTIVPIPEAKGQIFAVADCSTYKSSIGIIVVGTDGEVSLQEVIAAPIVLPMASNVVAMASAGAWLAASYRSGPVVLFSTAGADVEGESALAPMHILGVTGVHSMVLEQKTTRGDEDVVVYTAASGGLLTWRVPKTV